MGILSARLRPVIGVAGIGTCATIAVIMSRSIGNLEDMSLAPLLAAAFTIALAGALVPVINIEAFLVVLGPSLGPGSLLPVALFAAVGQAIGKIALYLVGRGTIRRAVAHRAPQALQHHGERIRRYGNPFILFSATTGLPPFFAVTLAAGAVRLPLPGFITWSFVGRFIRFTVFVAGPGWLLG